MMQKRARLVILLLVTMPILLSACNEDEKQRFVEVSGPLDKGAAVGDGVGAAPEKFGDKVYKLVHEFTVKQRTTVVQHIVGWIKVACVTPPPVREVARYDTEVWEYWKFRGKGSAWDLHETDASNLLGLLRAAARRVLADEPGASVDLECECFRAEQVSIETLFEGRVVDDGGNVVFLNDAEFEFPAAPKGSSPDAHWTFPDAQQPGTKHESANEYEGSDAAEVEIDRSKWWTATERATFYLGNCDADRKDSLPSGEVGYQYHESGGG